MILSRDSQPVLSFAKRRWDARAPYDFARYAWKARKGIVSKRALENYGESSMSSVCTWNARRMQRLHFFSHCGISEARCENRRKTDSVGREPHWTGVCVHRSNCIRSINFNVNQRTRSALTSRIAKKESARATSCAKSLNFRDHWLGNNLHSPRAGRPTYYISKQARSVV